MSSRRVLKGALYLLCAAAAIYSPLFTFQQLVVRGNVHLDEAELCEIARIQYGQRLFELKTDAMTTNLLHDLRIESAVVRRQLPNKIEMEIVERIPVATVACDYGYLDFDRQGKVIASYRTLKGADIPIITGVKLRDLYIGDDNSNAQVAQVITFLAKIDPADIGEISEVTSPCRPPSLPTRRRRFQSVSVISGASPRRQDSHRIFCRIRRPRVIQSSTSTLAMTHHLSNSQIRL